MWTVLTIFPGAIVCGVIAYVVAWLIMPAAAVQAVTPTPPPTADRAAEQTT